MPAPTCNGCIFWDPYAPGLGECLEYLTRRKAAFVTWTGPGAYTDAWPHIPAPDKADTDTCDKHEPLP